MESPFVYQKPRSQGHKLVPWLSWDEWNFVRESLFSSSRDAVAAALRRISAWRSRGCLPVLIEITATFIEAQQKDPLFNSGLALTSNPPHLDEMLASLYSMAIIRLVNGVIEKTRKREEVSIAVAARAIGLPRELIDIRHEASHRDLPSLHLVRIASKQALDWLKSYYWEPQRNAILLQRNEAARIRKDIECRLCEVFLCLKSRQSSRSSPSPLKGKGIKRGEWLSGSNKFLSHIAGKLPSTKSGGSKKSRERVLKNVVHLYSSFPSDVVSVLYEFLTKAMNSPVLLDLPESLSIGQNADSLQTSIDDWKLLVGKISKKEPKLLLNLMNVVLDNVVQTLEGKHFKPVSRQIGQLSSLTMWCAEKLKGLKHTHCKATLVGVLRKCLVVSAHSRDQFMGAAITLSQIIGSSFLFEKLSKFSLLRQSLESTETKLSHRNCESFLKQQEDLILRALEDLESIKFRNVKGETETNDDEGKLHQWVVAKSWHTCPIGMVPGALGTYALPVFGSNDAPKETPESSERKERWELSQRTAKREASSDIEILDTSKTKRPRETIEGCVISSEFEPHTNGKVCLVNSEGVSLAGVKGQLLMSGVWKEVGEEELMKIKSALKILV